MTTYGPCLVAPRLDQKPWGGRRLASFGFALPPDEPIGEALITAPEAVIVSGALSARTIGEVVADDPAARLGRDGLAATSEMPVFSLLIKMIDAERPLSIQVHPTDAAAPAGSLGKTEAWHVLDARPGAVVYAGLRTGVTTSEVAAAARSARPLVDLVNALPAEPGMTFLAPAGTIHALGGGLVIYEIQQPSAVTYRLDDWRKADDPTPPRELHVEQGIAALDPALCPVPIPMNPSLAVQRLTECAYFALDRISLTARESVTLGGLDGPRTLTCLSGQAELTSEAGSVAVSAGQTAVLFAGEGDLTVTGKREAVLLSGSVPSRS